ncbi:BQ5605_C006g03844 [Microbotryum silenes-dioicae]|uniref:BQ5605_C006g03844 protein n=1 Tax=Microbotryum silenes-dioicae TaxID=796604 RepID=A0A2X0M9E0_9BASI|nr:BQ5605_C006g03844 [Microbotryum silenes-dioicae]
MPIAELLAFGVSCRSRRRVSLHRVTRDVFLATDALIRISTFGRRVDKQYGALAQRSRHFGSLDGVELRFIKKACYFTHIDGTMPFRMIDGRQNLYKPHNCHRGYKELKFGKTKALLMPGATRDTCRSDRAPQATFDWPPRARKRSERVFEDF